VRRAQLCVRHDRAAVPRREWALLSLHARAQHEVQAHADAGVGVGVEAARRAGRRVPQPVDAADQPRADHPEPAPLLPASVASQYFLTRTDVT
jgi:hypothetical protein